MGRKRTSNKRDLKLYVDKDILEKLNYFKVNKSVLFTKTALNIIDQLEKEENG